MKPFSLRFPAPLAGAIWAALMPLSAQQSPYQGLWVGEVVLGGVNEVTVPLDANNVPRAPDPNVVTPTFDAANLRLILHVDSMGRTSLLKHVAILARKAGTQEKESDLALVTDERLYGAFPPQPATRISSVVFDFGDAKATAAVNRVADLAASAAATAAGQSGATVATVKTAAQQGAQPVIAQADATAAFSTFLQSQLDKAKVIAIANGGPASTAQAAAESLRDGSFYGDQRGVEMLAAIQSALAALPSGASSAEKEKTALNTAAAFAETDDVYERFLAGELFGDAVSDAAEAAATAAGSLELKSAGSFQTAAGGAAVIVTSPGHGLTTGEEIAIQGAGAGIYNGLHTVVRIDDNSFQIPVPYVAGGTVQNYSALSGIAPLRVSSPAHGLSTGARVTLRDSLGEYDGKHLITVLDADTFTIDVPYVSDPAERGTWSIRQGDISAYEGTADGSAGVKITAPGHGLDNGQRIEIRGSGSASYNGLKTITRIDADSFSISQAFDGNPAVKGTWEIPVAITRFQPPAVLPTLISAPGHLLATGGRVVISGAGKAEYNGEFPVTVVNGDSFSIPVAYDGATGNPTAKGSWIPAAGGKWRKTAAIRAALDDVAKVTEARTKALAAKITAYDDSRAPDALKIVLDAIVRSAALSDSALTVQVASLAEQAGRDALDTTVPRYPKPSTSTSTDYAEFVRSADFSGSVAAAAEAAAVAAMKEKSNLLATQASIKDKALEAAIGVLTPVFSAASRALLTELPMSGDFGPGMSGLAAEIVLPANHPTNPFRHRRHPDHTVGFDIRRLVNLSFLSQENQPVGRAGYGVDRIAGIYEEEIFGLHKPLGPSRDIGLKVRGTFQLNRISHIDTLNGR